MSKKGFTLIELMIVVAIIAIIAAFAIPALLRSRISANETGALNALKSMVANQANFQNVGVVDEDDDGAGEYGFFQEMAGTVAPRDADSAQRAPGEFCQIVFGQVNANGEASKSGYFFKMYIPNADPITGDADFAEETDGVVPNIAAAGIDLAENLWVAYAWPISRNRSGVRAFVISNDGTLYYTVNDDNAAVKYSGSGNGPVPTAAFYVDAANGIFTLVSEDQNNGAAYEGTDACKWLPLN